MRSFGLGTDPSILSELIAMLLLRGDTDELTFTGEEHAQLRRAFPNGFALIAYGDADDASNALHLKILGAESKATVEDIYAELTEDKLDLLQRLFEGAEKPG